MLKFLLSGMSIVTISSCAQTEYVDVQSSGIRHSSPEVISLYENEKVPTREKSSGFFSLSWLLDGMLGSDPDDDFHGGNHHKHERESSKRKREFVSRNGDSLRGSLESKKQ
ncbi:MAG: hypothetical protein ACSHX6_09805 [Akkermansiaceae bacterium]